MNKEDSFNKPNIVKQQIQEITKRLEELKIKHKKESDLIKEELHQKVFLTGYRLFDLIWVC